MSDSDEKNNRIRLNFILSLDSVPRPIEFYKYETVKSVKTQLCRGITCQTDWTPNQIHYKIKLYNQDYHELPDHESLINLVRDNIIWNEENIYMIISVDSGRMLDVIDNISMYFRKICIGFRPMSIREDPNHNYMFAWREKPPGSSYIPPNITTTTDYISPPGSPSNFDSPPDMNSSLLEKR